MLDHREELAENNHTPCPSSGHQPLSRHDSKGDREFSFWGSSNIIPAENIGDPFGSDDETKLSGNVQYEEGLGVWGTCKARKCKYECSPLLPRSIHCSDLSSTSRKQAIVEGRKELMEMIQDMPESCLELSFQDLVEERQRVQPVQKETRIDNRHIQRSSKAECRRQNKKKKNICKRPSQVSRVESMDNETFLLKMFFPTSLAWVKKAKVGNCLKVSPRPSFQESTKDIGKEWWIKKFFCTADNRSKVGDDICESKNSSSNKSRYPSSSKFPQNLIETSCSDTTYESTELYIHY